jgi:hypothetical protein
MEAMAATRGEEFRDDLRLAPARLLPAEVLRSLTELNDTRSWLAVLQTVGLMAAALAAALLWWTPWAVVPAVFLIATQQHAMFVLSHDAAHYRLSSNRTLNDIMGRLLATAAGLSMCTSTASCIACTTTTCTAARIRTSPCTAAIRAAGPICSRSSRRTSPG